MTFLNKKIKILLIEDDEVSQLRIAKNIKECGISHELFCANNLDEIEFHLQEEQWDLVISDYNLPGINGLEVIQLLANKEISVPVLMVTGQGDENQAAEIIKAGAMEYLSKDLITPDKILLSIRNALQSFANIKEKERALKKLKVSELQLKETQKLAKLGSWEYIIATDELLWSDETFRIFGLDPKKDSPSLIAYINSAHPEDRDVLSTMLDVAIKDQQKYTSIIRHKKIGEEDYIYLLGKGSVVVENGKVVKVYGSLMDITELKRVELELVKAKLKAENLVKIEQEFLANMSHEIRTPMNAIIGFTKILLEENFSADHLKKLNSIDQAGKNLLVIINDILDISKIKAGRLSLEKTTFNLHKCIEIVREQLVVLANSKKVALNFSISDSVPEYVVGDSVRLNQILINLVNNALKFTEKGFVAVNVYSIEEEAGSHLLQFDIKDSGIGITEDQQSKIFGSFSQASSDTTRKYGGTGLGLSICKQLIDLHAGKLWVNSEIGVGSTFSFQINYKKSEPLEQERSQQSAGVIDLEGVKILLVEDNEMNIELSLHILNKWKVKSTVARNGKEAIEKLEAGSFDIVLMDVSMPIMDGYECTRCIRSSKQDYSEIPIIAMTANAFADDVNLCYAAGMSDYISKPFDPTILKKKVQEFLLLREEVEFSNNSDDISTWVVEGICLDTLNGIAGGDKDFMMKMLQLYVEEAPLMLTEIEDSWSSSSYDRLRSAVHKYRSSATLLDLKEIAELSEFIELTQSENLQQPEVSEAVKQLLLLGRESVQSVEKIKQI